MKKVEDILAKCLDDIRAGRATPDECLEQYAAMRTELEPLLRLALGIHPPADIQPSGAFKSRARVNLMERIHAEQTSAKWWQFTRHSGFRHSLFIGKSKWATAVVAAFLAVILAGGSTAYASQGSLPGETLYTVKLGTEQVQRLVTIDDEASVQLELNFAEKRLQEMAAVAEENPSAMNTALTGYRANFTRAMEKAEEVNETDGETVSEDMASIINRQLVKLAEIEMSASTENTEEISLTRQLMAYGQIRNIEMLANHNPVKAAGYTLSGMDIWLEQASASTDEAQVENALASYASLLEESGNITLTAQNKGQEYSGICRMNAQAANRHLAMLGDIYSGASEQTRTVVEATIAQSLQNYYAATENLSGAASDVSVLDEPQLPDTIPENVKERILEKCRGNASGHTATQGNGNTDSANCATSHGQDDTDTGNQGQAHGNGNSNNRQDSGTSSGSTQSQGTTGNNGQDTQSETSSTNSQNANGQGTAK